MIKAIKLLTIKNVTIHKKEEMSHSLLTFVDSYAKIMLYRYLYQIFKEKYYAS